MADLKDEDIPGVLPAAQEVVAVARRALPLLIKNHEFKMADELAGTLDVYEASLERAQSTARQIRDERVAARDRQKRRFG